MSDDVDLWERAGRQAVAGTLEDASRDAEEALREISIETMYCGADPTPEQIREARRALNTARRILEEQVAPAAGCEEWGHPVPDMSMGRYREIASGADKEDWGPDE